MITRTVVEFDQHERQILATAGRSLGVAFPQIHEPTTLKSTKRPLDQREPLRVIAMGNTGTQGTWSHEHLAAATAVMAAQIVALERESNLDHWLAQHKVTTGQVLLPHGDPTSGYQQYATLAEIRAGQLADARKALKILMTAVNRTASPEDLAVAESLS